MAGTRPNFDPALCPEWHFDDLAAFFEFVEVVAPHLHHVLAVVEVFSAVVGRSQRVRYAVG